MPASYTKGIKKVSYTRVYRMNHIKLGRSKKNLVVVLIMMMMMKVVMAGK